MPLLFYSYLINQNVVVCIVYIVGKIENIPCSFCSCVFLVIYYVYD